MTYKDPYKGFRIENAGNFEGHYVLTPQRQSIRLPKSYTATQVTRGVWYVTNHMGRALKSGSALHTKIAAACEFQYSGREQ